MRKKKFISFFCYSFSILIFRFAVRYLFYLLTIADTDLVIIVRWFQLNEKKKKLKEIFIFQFELKLMIAQLSFQSVRCCHHSHTSFTLSSNANSKPTKKENKWNLRTNNFEWKICDLNWIECTRVYGIIADSLDRSG